VVHILNPVSIKVRIVFENDFLIKDYTSKLVKSILISGSKTLEEIFTKEKWEPKPIHITPLFKIEGSKKSAVYTRYIPSKETASPGGILERLKPIKIYGGVEYVFYIGTPLDLENEFLNSLAGVDRVLFGKEHVVVKRVMIEKEYIDLQEESVKLSEKLVSRDVDSIKIIFESPAMLKDPLVVHRERKKKIFYPLPEAVLSTPIYMILVSQGRLRKSVYIKVLRYIKTIFDTPYTTLKTVNIAWLVYNNKLVPGLIGYTKYFIDKQALTMAMNNSAKYNIDILDMLSKALALAKVYGVGTGRATGFGHISIQI